MKKTLACMAVFFLVFTAGLVADEGMWLPHQMKDLDLAKQGLKMNPEDLYKKDGTGLMSAVVSLGGATGEFVSADGLILTNHHVAFGAVQRVSDKEHDYLANGFSAASREQEIPAPGAIADILTGYEDVTPQILKALMKPGLTPLQRYQAIDLAIKKIVRQRESQGKDLTCTVRSMYSGGQYFLFTFKRLKDIRLVCVPPLTLGNFGGEVDNWVWPRHTCDFTFFRAYVSKENVGVEYSKENVPYRPKVHLKIALDGVQEGDFTFIMGYPGRTYRNSTLSEMAVSFEALRKRIVTNLDIIHFLEGAGKDKRDIEIKYASRVKGLYNSLKNSQGKLEGLEKISLLSRVEERERRFYSWANQEPARKAKYGAILGAIEKFMARNQEFTTRQEAASSLTGAFSPTLLGQAYQIYRLAVERQKPDLERESGFQERDLASLRRRLETAERSFDPAVDRAFFKFALGRIQLQYRDALPRALKKALPQFSEKAAGEWVDSLYERTALIDPAKRLALFEMKLPQLLKENDPLITLAAELEAEIKGLREEARGMGQELADLKKVYEAGFQEMNGGRLAPDANGTIRFTSGPVSGYSPRDAVLYLPQTTLRGVIEKDTGRELFAVPAKLKSLYLKRDFGAWRDPRLNDVPACFLNTTNVTGGNSGSPVLNARGEQVGIIFDMTYESVTGDYFIVPELQRSIAVDIRYVLFIVDKFIGAAALLDEMGIPR